MYLIILGILLMGILPLINLNSKSLQACEENSEITRINIQNNSNSTVPFDGMYYMWQGVLGGAGYNPWQGSDNFTRVTDEIYHVEQDLGWAGYDSRDINVTDRMFYNSSAWVLGGHDWTFIPIDVNLGETVLIAYLDGDHVYNVSGRVNLSSALGWEFDCWRLEDTVGSVAYYDIYTGLLINGTFRQNPTYWYSFNVTATNVQFQNNTHAPLLTDGIVTPSEGNTSVYYEFTVNYTDADNNAPHPITVIIDGVPYAMKKQNLTDYDYTDGAVFEYITALDSSSHDYFFNVSDLVHITQLPTMGNFSGPNVTYVNAQPPTLSNGFVTPPSGHNYTDYRFQVTYQDMENNPPLYVNVTINGTAFAMEKQDPYDDDYIDGAIYFYETKLTDGIHMYHFNASDGSYSAFSPFNGSYVGPSVYLAYWALWDDVESGQNGWTITGPPVANSTFGWHITERDASSPTHAWWCGDNATGEYHDNWNTSLVSPTVNLTSAYSAIFSFYHKAELEPLNDFAYIEIEVNGTGLWSELAQFKQDIPSWTKEVFNLSAYLGEYVNIRFRFKSDISLTFGGWFIDDIVIETQQNSFAPVLDQGIVTPATGNMSTLYTYSVMYSDPDGNSPAYVSVTIDGSNHTMSKENFGDNDFVSGVKYVHMAYLDNSSHEYFFSTSDGLFGTREPIIGNNTGPIVTATYAIPPTLTGMLHDPANDRLVDPITFNVTYTDVENTPPGYVNITINGTSYTMNKVNPNDENYMDGAIYQYQRVFSEDGVYVYNFSASDGHNEVNSPINGSYTGPYLYQLRLSHSTTYQEEITTQDHFDNFMFEVSSMDWGAVAIRPPQNGTNLGLEVYEDYQLTCQCLLS